MTRHLSLWASKAGSAWLLIPIGSILAACDLPSAGCDAMLRDAIQVAVHDADTGLPAASGVTGWVQDGAYMDSLRVSGWAGPPFDSTTAARMSGARERAGRYDVYLRKPGYAPWQQLSVRVHRNSCGVIPAELQANLVPEP
jgi:hypothetical protein